MPSVYKINDGENIFDIVLATYGTPELLYKLISDNKEQFEAQGVSLTVDLDLRSCPGLSFVWDEQLEKTEEVASTLAPQTAPVYKYLIKEDQTLFDIALMVYGSVEKVVQIMQDLNASAGQNMFTLNHGELTGRSITYNDELIEDKSFIEYLIKNNLVITTAYPRVNVGSGFDSGFYLQSIY